MSLLHIFVHSVDPRKATGSLSPVLEIRMTSGVRALIVGVRALTQQGQGRSQQWGSGSSRGGQWGSGRSRGGQRPISQATSPFTEVVASFSRTRSCPSQGLMVLIGFSCFSSSLQSFLYQGLKRNLRRIFPRFLLPCQVLQHLIEFQH